MISVTSALLAVLTPSALPARLDPPPSLRPAPIPVSNAPIIGRADVPDTQYGLTDAVGPYRVGMHLSVRPPGTLVVAHYFYATRLTDIPLRGGVTGSTVTLTEPGGAFFRLRFAAPAIGEARPSGFNGATALVGTWTQAGRSYPVHLGFDLIGGPQGAERYRDVTREPAAAYETRVKRFITGALVGNPAAAAAFVSFPLTVRSRTVRVISTRTQLLVEWPLIFDSCLIAAQGSAA